MDLNTKNDEEFEEDMKDELDSVMGLLDKMKEERQEELLSTQSERFSRLERLKRSRQGEGESKDEKGTKYRTEVESRSYVEEKPVEVKVRLGEDVYREGQQKRKQDTVVAELREKAEIISKSARKGPEDLASTLARSGNVEDDPEAAKYLQKIRETATTDEKKESEAHLEKNTVVVDFPSLSSPRKTSVSVKLNLDMQKSKIAVARGAGRRKPTTEHIRRSLVVSDEEEPEDALARFDDDLDDDSMDADDEDEPATPIEIKSVEASVSKAIGVAETKVMPQSPVEYGQKITLERRGSFEGLIPRSTPKPRKPAWKSKTYGGVALPAFADAMKAGTKSLKKTDTAERLLTADVVKQAAIDKLNRAAKEDIPEKEPEKPAWLVEAEARRKLHDRRRHTGDHEKIKPSEAAENQAIPIRLKKTGSRLLEEDIDKVEKDAQDDDEDDSKTSKFVFKLKPTGGKGENQSFEPEPAKISFKLKPTGIQLVQPEQPKDEGGSSESPVMATLVKDFESEPPAPASIRLRHVAPKVKPEEPRPEDTERGTHSIRLRHISPKPITKDFESTSEPELATKLRLRGKAQPIHPDEDDLKDQVYRGSPALKTVKPSDEPPVRKPQSPTTFETPRPIKVVATNEYREPSGYNKSSDNKSGVANDYRRPSGQREPSRYSKSSDNKVGVANEYRGPSGQREPSGYREPSDYKAVAANEYRRPSGHREPSDNKVGVANDYRRSSGHREPSGYREPSDYKAVSTNEYRRPSGHREPSGYREPSDNKVGVTNEYRRPSGQREPSDFKAVTLERKPLETAKLINQQPMRTTAESTPPLSQTRATPKQSYKVTPLPSEPTRRSSYGSAPRVYDLPVTSPSSFSQPQSPSSSRTFSPLMSPMSKVTAVSHHVTPTPSSFGRSVLPAKSSRGRRISGERSKTVVVSGSEVQRIIPGRRTNSSDDPQRHPVRRTSSLEYPRSHVERAADGYLKHAVTVVEASPSTPRKAKTLMATDRAYSPRYAASEEFLPVSKHESIDGRRKPSSSRSDQDVSVQRSWSSLSNKENEPRIVTQLEPKWMRELDNKKRNAYNLSSASSDIQYDRMEALERLETRSAKTVDSDDEVREVPGFMKEFERKRRMKTRGFQLIQQTHPNDESYV